VPEGKGRCGWGAKEEVPNLGIPSQVKLEALGEASIQVECGCEVRFDRWRFTLSFNEQAKFDASRLELKRKFVWRVIVADFGCVGSLPRNGLLRPRAQELA
jgi:hypothetical protein